MRLRFSSALDDHSARKYTHNGVDDLTTILPCRFIAGKQMEQQCGMRNLPIAEALQVIYKT